jgi:acyl-CoA synthetase (NDP forming)
LTAAPEAVAEGVAIIGEELAAGAGWMTPEAVIRLLDVHGVPQAPARVVHSVTAAVAAGRELGWPVAIKAVARGLVHKHDVGAVATSLRSPAAVRRAATAIRNSVTSAGFELDGLLVQRMIPGGVELLVGMVQDASFGPVVACGAGGTNTELFKDVAVRITPVTDRDAAEMVRDLQLYPLLMGYRGSVPCDVAAVQTILMRIGAMVDAHPDIAELDCNPVIAGPNGAVVVDARVRLHEPAPTRPLPSVGR